jgi:NAD+ diphosphatase
MPRPPVAAGRPLRSDPRELAPDERSLRNRFAGLSLDRRDEWRVDPERVRATWSSARLVVIDVEGRAAAQAHALARIDARELDASVFAAASFLGMQDGQSWFALPAAAWNEASRGDDTAWVGLREAAASWPAFDSGIFAYAKALLLWQSRARHCGACGAATSLIRAGHCARCSNPECGLQQFPRTDAAIIVIVTDGTRCLLGRQPGWPPGRYSTLAGFVEPGESLEDAVRREVREEAGVLVGACEYQSSQPWPFPGALMVGFRAEAHDPTLRIGDELEDARWFEAADLVAAVRRGETGLPPDISVSRRLVEDWLQDVLGTEAIVDLRDR